VYQKIKGGDYGAMELRNAGLGVKKWNTRLAEIALHVQVFEDAFVLRREVLHTRVAKRTLKEQDVSYHVGKLFNCLPMHADEYDII
jgi:hypothetical protein